MVSGVGLSQLDLSVGGRVEVYIILGCVLPY
jgi:hypothetical protein